MTNNEFSFRIKHYRFKENKINHNHIRSKKPEPVVVPVSVPEPVVVSVPVLAPENNAISLQKEKINKIKKDLRDNLKNKK